MAPIDRVLDAGRVIERQSNTIAALRLENQELRNSSGPEVVAAAEQRVAALDEEVSRLKAELEESQARSRTEGPAASSGGDNPGSLNKRQ
ncbi:hypothetical protein C4D60_Mb07t19000 [Musa balbisiana]|uniref:Uncharacterized protein n=1 Tax=Musa balbisiana TaxID=52838 RepID=A0A4S8JIV3_MUSBA|nr:hypothetical protein C4D60_Mb07t19000 [Musa balbisiana]